MGKVRAIDAITSNLSTELDLYMSCVYIYKKYSNFWQFEMHFLFEGLSLPKPIFFLKFKKYFLKHQYFMYQILMLKS